MRLTDLVTGIVVITGLAACHHKSPTQSDWYKSPSTGQATATTTKEKDVCRTEDDTSIAPEAQVQRRTITLARNFQQVRRRDCNGAYSQPKREQVQTPDSPIEIHPVAKFDGERVEGRVVNRTTCQTYTNPDLADIMIMGVILAPIKMADEMINGKVPTIRVTVDTSPAWLHLHVLKNHDNYLDYEFYNCIEQADKTCKADKTVEKGTLILTVKYEEKELDGVKDVEDCNKKD